MQPSKKHRPENKIRDDSQNRAAAELAIETAGNRALHQSDHRSKRKRGCADHSDHAGKNFPDHRTAPRDSSLEDHSRQS